jgi:hypothetical protein
MHGRREIAHRRATAASGAKRKFDEMPTSATRYRIGHPDHIKAFADPEAAERWFEANDPESVAFE